MGAIVDIFCFKLQWAFLQSSSLSLNPCPAARNDSGAYYANSHVFTSSIKNYTPWCRVLLQELNGLQLVKKFPAFYGTRRFITALTSVHHLSLSWASPIQSTYPHPTSWRSILILSTHLRLGLPSGLFSSGFPTNAIHPPLLTHMRHMPSPSHSSRFYHPQNIG